MKYVKMAFIDGTHASFRDSYSRIVMVEEDVITTIPLWNDGNSSTRRSMFSALIKSVFDAWGNKDDRYYDKSKLKGNVLRVRKDTGIHKLVKNMYEYDDFGGIVYYRQHFKEFVNFVRDKSGGKKIPMNSRKAVQEMSKKELMKVVDAMAEYCDDYITIKALDKVI